MYGFAPWVLFNVQQIRPRYIYMAYFVSFELTRDVITKFLNRDTPTRRGSNFSTTVSLRRVCRGPCQDRSIKLSSECLLGSYFAASFMKMFVMLNDFVVQRFNLSSKRRLFRYVNLVTRTFVILGRGHLMGMTKSPGVKFHTTRPPLNKL